MKPNDIGLYCRKGRALHAFTNPVRTAIHINSDWDMDDARQFVNRYNRSQRISDDVTYRIKPDKNGFWVEYDSSLIPQYFPYNRWLVYDDESATTYTILTESDFDSAYVPVFIKVQLVDMDSEDMDSETSDGILRCSI